MMILPSTISEATRTLKNLSNEAKILAGGTWVMRAPIRDEYEDKIFVSLKNISSLYKCEIKNNHISLGALMTHQHIAEKLSNIDELQCLKQAVLASANPAIRGMATIGGNICTSDFLASDLVPALIASDAKILFQSCESKNQMSIEQYLKTRTKRQKDDILTSIQIPRGDFRSAHVRLLMRKAGEYPIANLSIRYSIDETGSVQEARIVVGAVESTVRRWIKLENALNNKKLSNLNMLEIAKGNLDEFIGRDGPDAPGWYRTRVLPKLLFDAFAQTAQEFH